MKIVLRMQVAYAFFHFGFWESTWIFSIFLRFYKFSKLFKINKKNKKNSEFQIPWHLQISRVFELSSTAYIFLNIFKFVKKIEKIHMYF